MRALASRSRDDVIPSGKETIRHVVVVVMVVEQHSYVNVSEIQYSSIKDSVLSLIL